MLVKLVLMLKPLLFFVKRPEVCPVAAVVSVSVFWKLFLSLGLGSLHVSLSSSFRVFFVVDDVDDSDRVEVLLDHLVGLRMEPPVPRRKGRIRRHCLCPVQCCPASTGVLLTVWLGVANALSYDFSQYVALAGDALVQEGLPVVVLGLLPEMLKHPSDQGL